MSWGKESGVACSPGELIPEYFRKSQNLSFPWEISQSLNIETAFHFQEVLCKPRERCYESAGSHYL